MSPSIPDLTPSLPTHRLNPSGQHNSDTHFTGNLQDPNCSTIFIFISNSDDSDSADEAHSMHPKKCPRFLAPSNHQCHKASTRGNKEQQRPLVAKIDWDNYWWETQKISTGLKDCIKDCGAIKSTHSDTDPCPVLSLLSDFRV